MHRHLWCASMIKAMYAHTEIIPFIISSSLRGCDTPKYTDDSREEEEKKHVSLYFMNRPTSGRINIFFFHFFLSLFRRQLNKYFVSRMQKFQRGKKPFAYCHFIQIFN